MLLPSPLPEKYLSSFFNFDFCQNLLISRTDSVDCGRFFSKSKIFCWKKDIFVKIAATVQGLLKSFKIRWSILIPVPMGCSWGHIQII
jgi:hypothetical protein